MNPDHERTFRQRLGDRYEEHPLLRLCIAQPWFLAAGCALLLSGVGLLVGLPKIWVATPPGFNPVVRTSLLDRFQAWSFARRARAATAAGQYLAAVPLWGTALANNPANVSVLRAAIANVIQCEPLDRRLATHALNSIDWLLRLTQTNRQDVTLAAQVYGRCGLPGDVYELLRPRENELVPAEEGPYLKALFHAGELDEFRRRWDQMGSRTTADPELSLYHAAYLAGWGPVETAATGRRALAQAATATNHWVLACQLQLIVDEQLGNAEEFGRVLRRLDRASLSRPVEHTRYWLLLAANGQRTEARRLAAAYPQTPKLPWEVLHFANAYDAIGMEPEALKLLAQAAPESCDQTTRWSTRLWMKYCDLLLQAERWSELADAAAQMRGCRAIQKEMEGYAELMDGRAQLGLERMELAVAAFKQVPNLPFPSPAAALHGARILKRVGQLPQARDLLQRIEADLDTDPEYWRAALEVAGALREDSLWLLKSAQRLHQLQPQNDEVELEYALALIVNRQSPGEAAQITLKALNARPTSMEARLNHSLALIQNQRIEEARQLLAGVEEQRLPPPGRAWLHLAWYEIQLTAGTTKQAIRERDAIDRQWLFPAQSAWIEQSRERPATQRTGQSG